MGNCINRNKKQTLIRRQTQTPAPTKTPTQTIQQMTINAIHFVVPITEGWCISVYDGDTITIATELNMNGITTLYKFNVRIRGIDCPEIRTKNEIEKQYAIKAKEFVNKLCYGKLIQLENVDYDKYGRILADVYIDGILVAQQLLDRKLAVKYDGKKKQIVDWHSIN